MSGEKFLETPEKEIELFLKEVEGVKKIEGGKDREFIISEKAPLLPDERKEWKVFITKFMRDTLSSFEIHLTTEYVEGRKKGVSPYVTERLRRGDFAVEEKLDLHGMRRVEARNEVKRFIIKSVREGKRCLLIVHGRGKRSKGGIAVLKSSLVRWLDAASGLGKYILAFTTARPCDGGTGAVYVLLGKTQWFRGY